MSIEDEQRHEENINALGEIATGLANLNNTLMKVFALNGRTAVADIAYRQKTLAVLRSIAQAVAAKKEAL